MNIILGALVRRIKQRAYLDTDEEIARWIEEYCEQSNSHKHGVSGKQPCKWNGNLDACGNEVCWDLQECQGNPVACTSSGVVKTVSDGKCREGCAVMAGFAIG